MVLSGWVIFLIICLVTPIILICTYQYDLRFDRFIDPVYHSNFPGISKIISIIKLILRYIFRSTLLAWLISLLYNFIAGKTGWTVYPVLTLANIRGFVFIEHDIFWYVAAGSAWVISIWDIIRCTRTPLKYDLPKSIPPVQHQPVREDTPSDDLHHWDVFISYKSEDVDLARRISNHLLASGVKVWFAEYQVLLQNFNQFQDAIDFGIANSTWAICLTNNRYIGSDYCILELKQMLDYLPQSNILEIMIPKEELPHQKFQTLDNCPAVLGSDLPTIFTLIHKHTGWDLKPLLPDVINTEPSTNISTCLGRDVTLDITDWRVTTPGKIKFGSTDIVKMDYIHRQEEYHLMANLVCGREYAREGERIGQKINDRRMFDLLRKHAEKHTVRLNAKVYGLHLVFHQGLSQFAITYRMFGYWTRKYSIIFPNPVTSQNAEFVFTFGFLGSFNQFCQNVHLMDRLVKSLQWK